MLEFVQRLGSFALATVTMNRGRRQPVLLQLAGDAIRVTLHAGENQNLLHVARAHQMCQQRALLRIGNFEYLMADEFCRRIAARDFDHGWAAHELLGEPFYFVGKRR